MSSKEELIEGFRSVIRQADRVTSGFGEDDWAKPVNDGEGWNRKQTFCHITATAEIAPGFLGSLAGATENDNPMDSIDINGLNAQMVAGKEALSPPDLIKNLTASYEKLIEFTQGMPQEQLDSKRNFGLLTGGTLSDVMDSVLVLHAIAHIYSAGGNAA
ncbi:MAG: maleylpyruvate isomerase N-terminal domain-containing protein [Dehalococcoidia bacterium]